MAKTFLLIEGDLNDALLISQAINQAAPLVRVQLEKSAADAARYLKGEARVGDQKAYPMPDLILLDLDLPHFDGFEFLEWLRHEPSPICHIPVVMISGKNTPEDVTRAYQLGASSFVTKPAESTEYRKRMMILAGYWSLKNVAGSHLRSNA